MKALSRLAISLVPSFFLFTACGHKATGQLTPAEEAAFEQASPEMKAIWVQASAAARTNGYTSAYNLLYELGGLDLTPDQKQAVAQASAALNARMLAAIEKNDPDAQKALEEMRQHPPNRAGSRE